MRRTKVLYAGVIAVILVANVHATLISFQQGDLRGDGALIDSAYQTKAATLRGGTQADTLQTSAAMYIGDHNTGAMHGLFGFDLSYLETLANGNPYVINSVTFSLTINQINAGFTNSASTFGAYLTGTFDETTATYNNPGPGQAVGGTIGALLSNKTVTSNDARTVNAVVSWTGAAWNTAVSNALSGASNELDFMVKRGTETGAAGLYIRPADDEYAQTYAPNARPELIVDITVIPEPATIGLLGAGTLVILMVRRRMMR